VLDFKVTYNEEYLRNGNGVKLEIETMSQPMREYHVRRTVLFSTSKIYNMEKKIEDYLHLYIGAEVFVKTHDREFVATLMGMSEDSFNLVGNMQKAKHF